MTIPRHSPQWFAGYDKQCAWLKYGADPDWILSLVRCWDTPGIELAIRVSDPAATNLDIPGYAPFSIEAGLSDSMAMIDGVGVRGVKWFFGRETWTLTIHILCFSCVDGWPLQDPRSPFMLGNWLCHFQPIRPL